MLSVYSRLVLTELTEARLCYAISRFGIIRMLPATAVMIRPGDDVSESLGVTEFWLHPPKCHTAWQSFDGTIHMYSPKGRFGIHTAYEDDQISGELHAKPGYSTWNVSTNCITFSLDDWALEARCARK